MYKNNEKLPRGYIVHVARNSDIFKIISLYINEIYQSKKGILTLIAILPLPSISIFCSLILSSSYFMALVVTLLYAVSIVLMFFIPVYFCWMIIIKGKECLVICNQKKVCAVLVASNYGNYSYIKGLFVGSLYRRKGLARYLMEKALNNLNYPIYLLSIPKLYLLDFYTSLGFVFIKENQLPRQIRKCLNNYVRYIPMTLEKNSSH